MVSHFRDPLHDTAPLHDPFGAACRQSRPEGLTGDVLGPDDALALARQTALDLRQLRHQTKNSLQRIMGELARSTALFETSEGRRLIGDLEHRIMLSAQVSDLLFSVVGQKETLAQRIEALGRHLIDLLSSTDQSIALHVNVAAAMPPERENVVLRVAHEMLANAVKHGMHQRIAGSIAVDVQPEAGCIMLRVSDDGWGFGASLTRCGEGLQLMRELAEKQGGSVALRRHAERTCAELRLPHDA